MLGRSKYILSRVWNEVFVAGIKKPDESGFFIIFQDINDKL
tara:strand:+ start:513 stop:635 length:123 start_codon:yes stop_codon:yes gene_type:complete